jgi:hypothetical protein
VKIISVSKRVNQEAEGFGDSQISAERGRIIALLCGFNVMHPELQVAGCRSVKTK